MKSCLPAGRPASPPFSVEWKSRKRQGAQALVKNMGPQGRRHKQGWARQETNSEYMGNFCPVGGNCKFPRSVSESLGRTSPFLHMFMIGPRTSGQRPPDAYASEHRSVEMVKTVHCHTEMPKKGKTTQQKKQRKRQKEACLPTFQCCWLFCSTLHLPAMLMVVTVTGALAARSNDARALSGVNDGDRRHYKKT